MLIFISIVKINSFNNIKTKNAPFYCAFFEFLVYFNILLILTPVFLLHFAEIDPHL